MIQKDTDVLNVIADKMNAEFILTKKYKSRSARSFMVNSKYMVERLQGLCVFEHKSLSVKFPDIPEQFLPDFIRGVIDGDGWVQDRGYVMNITSGSAYFTDGLFKVFSEWGLRTEITDEFTKAGYVYRVWVKGKEDVAKLSDIIYNDCDNMFLKKKRVRMEQRSLRSNKYVEENGKRIASFN